ncbi:MAG: hypothetical protein KKF62_03805 [Bacteroidetes bacterium]|nr:hypothetical protein [Bacteroidota bacterium]MBU1117160.1 hypothetical protein [Bacteroidota bacterium]MBU1798568.1 hypothetical protein [Bacteroidota bacterium]
MKQKIGIITMGCSKNAVDSERLMAQLKINDFSMLSMTIVKLSQNCHSELGSESQTMNME